MKRLAKLTTPDGKPVHVNPDHVMRVDASTVPELPKKSGGTQITLSGGSKMNVMEDVDDVVSKLQNAAL